MQFTYLRNFKQINIVIFIVCTKIGILYNNLRNWKMNTHILINCISYTHNVIAYNCKACFNLYPIILPFSHLSYLMVAIYNFFMYWISLNAKFKLFVLIQRRHPLHKGTLFISKFSDVLYTFFTFFIKNEFQIKHFLAFVNSFVANSFLIGGSFIF